VLPLMSLVPDYRKEYEIPDYQKQYEGILHRVDSNPLPKAAFEKILSLHQDSPFKPVPAIIDAQSQQVIGKLEQDLLALRRVAEDGRADPWAAYCAEWSAQGKAFYACKLDETIAQPEDIIKTYIAYGRLNASYGWRLGGSTQKVRRQQRFKGWPRLQALANAFMIGFDSKIDDDWVKLSVYAKERFPEVNPKHKKYDSISKHA